MSLLLILFMLLLFLLDLSVLRPECIFNFGSRAITSFVISQKECSPTCRFIGSGCVRPPKRRHPQQWAKPIIRFSDSRLFRNKAGQT